MKFIKKHNITWWKALIFGLIAYGIFALIVTTTLDRKTLYVVAHERVETYNSINDIYTESSWLAYEKSISKIKEYIDEPFVSFDEMQDAVYSVNRGYANLVIDENRVVDLPYESVMRYPDKLRGKAVNVKGVVVNKTLTSLGPLLVTVNLNGNASKPVYLAFKSHAEIAENFDIGDELDALGYSYGVYELGVTLPDGVGPYVKVNQASNLSKPNTNK